METKRSSIAAARSRDCCVGCPLDGGQLCRHTPGGILDFGMLAVGFFVPFVVGMMISGYWLALGLWLLLAVLFFGYVEALVLCRHCPRYHEGRLTVRCRATHSLARVPGFRLHPLTRREEVIFLSYAGVLGLYYVPFLLVSEQWAFLLIASLALVAWVRTLVRTKCTRCCHVFCPVNRVPEELREQLFEQCPVLTRAGDRSAVLADQWVTGGDSRGDE